MQHCIYKSDLIRRLESKDKSVRFIEYGYKIGEQSSKELENNTFIIALAGKKAPKS
jgi:hypothetical protein